MFLKVPSLSFTVQMIIGGHRSIVCKIICKIMIGILIVYKQRVLISDVFMENLFVNSAVIDLSNGEIVIFMS